MAAPDNRSTSASSEEVGAGSRGPAPTAPFDPAEEPAVNPAVEAFHRIKDDAAELKEYAGYYLSAKIDGFRRTLRNLGLYAALGVLGLIAGGAIIATAAGLLIVGFARGLGALFGGMYWLGDIVAGIVVLAIIAGAVWFMMNKLTGVWKSQTVKKYEQRKQSQRERFGHDIDDRAARQCAEERRQAK
jgi:hypothetical protein